MFDDSEKKKYILLALILVTFFLIYYDLFLLKKVFVHDTITWYGSFHYYVESLAKGHFPYWDPYLISGTLFYPYISLHGNLDPIVLVGVFLSKVFNITPLTIYIYFRLLRLFIFVIGEYYFFRHITKCDLSAMLSASILLFVFPLTYFRQFGALDAIYLTPFALYFILLFLEDPAGPRKYLYIAAITLITGISMAIYIPVFYLLNVISFTVGIFIFKMTNFREVARSLRDKKFAAFLALSFAAVIMMTAPSLMVMFKDASGDGELFPMQRIIQRNKGSFKKVMASDINTSNLSNKFTNKRAIYNTWGEIANLLFPDLVTFKYWQEHDLQSEIDHYVGIIPFVFCILGFIYFKSRYKYVVLIMLAVNFINGFSFSGFGDRQYNLLQDFFNMIFPPLKMYQGRENLGYFVLLYLCVMASMGMSIFFKREHFPKEKYRLIITICLIFIGVKIAISGYFAGKFIATSAYDFLVLLQLMFFSVWVFMYSKEKIPQKIFYGAIIFVIIADFYMYNENAKEYSIQDSRPFYNLLAATENTGNLKSNFQYFREPALQGPAFTETISGIKGALSMGLNHSLFTTKRYYDFFTHVPLQNQFVLNGMVYPVVQFFPLDKVMQVRDKKELLNFYSTDSSNIAQYLFVEGRDAKTETAEELKDFSQYEDASELAPGNIFYLYSMFVSENRDYITGVRENLYQFLNTPLYSIAVKKFSVNETAIFVTNSIDGYLYYNDGWSRYWQAFDNGREIPVKIANYNFKAVFLQKGDHTVRFVFNPVHYKIGLVAYYIGLLSCTWLIIVLWFKSRKTQPLIL